MLNRNTLKNFYVIGTNSDARPSLLRSGYIHSSSTFASSVFAIGILLPKSRCRAAEWHVGLCATIDQGPTSLLPTLLEGRWSPPLHPNLISGRVRGKNETGGAMMSLDTCLTENKKFVGSAMIVEAESIEAVRKQVESDIYLAAMCGTRRSLPFSHSSHHPPLKA
ncbi:hypothetical protein BXZ70DRAFT_740196 [Cristinia sonorae]|uniref:YCII-related domain-containing protein n=1 Tax=Cristinia sonorae TaxID=1940300 RepID=A0A8K0UU88_9AGAR|nr:hypothetical protein BXZ70DRAFT_740196 [Cristinia sonorae]